MRYWGDERIITKSGKMGRKTASGERSGSETVKPGRARPDEVKSRVARPGAVRLNGGTAGRSSRGSGIMDVGSRFWAAGSRSRTNASTGGGPVAGGSTTGGGARAGSGRSGGGSRLGGSRSRGGRTGGGKPRKGSSIAAGGSLKNYPFLRNFYRHQAQISERVQKIVFFLILAGMIYAFLLGENGFVRIALLRAERAGLDSDIAELQQSEALLAEEIERLKTEDFYIEKMGREKFGYVKPGDRVYRLIPIDDRGM